MLSLVLALGVAASASAQEDLYSRAESLAWSRRFREAELEYRSQLARRPRDWRLRLGLARVLLWSAQYREADRAFGDVLRERPGDPAALLGFAQAAYWSGDLRAAHHRFRDVLQRDPGNAEASKALAELEELSAPRYDVRAAATDDSQPYGTFATQLRLSYFSDPATRWDVLGRVGSVEDGRSAFRSLGAGVSTTLTLMQIGLGAAVESFQFPNGETKVLGSARLSRKTPWRGKITIGMERAPLLATAVSVDDAATVTRSFASWERDPGDGLLAAVHLHRFDYFDDNRGLGADGWFLAPVGSATRAGLSAAWRDTDEERFRFTGFRSEARGNAFHYEYSGVYDPYWTPLDLREVRGVVTYEWKGLKLQADGGIARDRARSFGPGGGPTPTPFSTFPVVIDRTFHPWRASAQWTQPLGSRIELRARVRHEVTSFYRLNEIEASLGGRL
jgi:hypothetical protein